MNVNQIRECLKDSGCSTEQIEQFLSVYRKSSIGQQIRLIRRYRFDLMEKLHRVQREVDCLDYLIHEMKKEDTSYRSININKHMG